MYQEDDISLILPNNIEEVISKLLILKNKNRNLGYISFTLGGSTFSYESDNGDLLNNNLKLYEDTESLVLLRDESIASKYFINYPTAIFNTYMYKQINEDSLKYKGLEIETSLTKAYFNLNMDKKYYKVSICKNNLYTIIKNERRNMDKKCLFIKELDPHQGMGYYLGNANV